MNELPWVKIDVLDSGPAGKASDGTAEFAVSMRVTFQWWRWSFLRFVRDHIEVEPRWLSWLAWPMALWVVLRHGPTMNRSA